MQTTKYFMRYLIKAVSILLVMLLSLLNIGYSVSAQTVSHHPSAQERRANELFARLRYMQAIEEYTILLQKEPDNTDALSNLATCYRKLNDHNHAAYCYAQLTKKDSLHGANFLYYAQSLSANQKYPEALSAYKKYAFLKPDDNRSAAFINAYANLPAFYKDSGSIHIELLNINSGQSDFSPAYYKKGIVFCSNRNEGQIIKHIFEWNQSAFLDLYYAPDTATLRAARETSYSTADYHKRRKGINDDDTYATSNDNATTGYTNINYKDTGGIFTIPEAAIIRLSHSLSSKYHEGPVSFFSSQDSLILTRNNYDNRKYGKGNDGITKLKLYSASYSSKDSSWQNTKGLPFNNDNYSTAHPAIAPGDSILYFISDMPGGFGGADIYRSYYRNGNWSVPENIGSPVNTEGNEMFPFIDSDNTLYFASDGHPGLGGLDLFKISLTKPGTIHNLGYPTNSSFDDFGLIFTPKTRSGFFSSNRRRGLGDDDIYRIKIDEVFSIQVIDGISKKPIPLSTIQISEVRSHDTISPDFSQTGLFNAYLKNNLRYTITGFADGYAPNQISATANASDSIITVPLFKPQCIITGIITDKDTKLPLDGARMVIYDLTEHDTIYDYMIEANGKYQCVTLKPNHQYSLNASGEGYFNRTPFLLNTGSQRCGIDPAKGYDYLKNFELEKIIIGRAIKIENIYFDLAKYTIRPKAAKELDKIVKMMQENPNIIIELSSHTDCRSSYTSNLTLSDNRAKASANYIISKGIDASRITGKGYGETKPVNDCTCEGKLISRKCTEAEHQANRRTEFQVTGFLAEKNDTMEKSLPGNDIEKQPGK